MPMEKPGHAEDRRFARLEFEKKRRAANPNYAIFVEPGLFS
jgi:hypothetical protein